MSRKFYAVNRETGERWNPKKHTMHPNSFLVMYDSGYLAVVSSDGWSTIISPLDNQIWEVVK